MIYVKLDSRSLTNAKLLAVGPLGFALYVKGLCYAKEHMTDGVIPSAALPLIGLGIDSPQQVVVSLVAAGLWEECEGGWTVGGDRWAEHQTTKEQVNAQREAWAERSRKYRAAQRQNAQDDVAKPPHNNDPSRVTQRDITSTVTQASRVTHASVTHPESESESESEPNKERTSKEVPKKVTGMHSLALPHGQRFRQAWEEWVVFRKQLKKTLTPSTAERQIKMLARHPEPVAVQIIELSIVNGWQGLFPDRIANNPAQKPDPFTVDFDPFGGDA